MSCPDEGTLKPDFGPPQRDESHREESKGSIGRGSQGPESAHQDSVSKESPSRDTVSKDASDRAAGSADSVPWTYLEEVSSRLEDAWQQGGTVDLGEFLPAPNDPRRAPALRELIKTELEIRWRRGDRITLEKYLERFPELGTLQTLPASLVYEEYRVRQLHGDRPSLTLYQKRFPGQYTGLEQLLQRDPVPVPPPSSGSTLSSLRAAASPSRPGTVRDSFHAPGSRAGGSAPGGSTAGGSTAGSGYGDEGYKIFECIGRGTFGEVYRAEARGEIPVAIKRVFKSIEEEEAQRELQALKLIKQLRHPFLLSTHEFWIEASQLMIVTELADGNLRDRLKARMKEGETGLPIEELIRYMIEAAQAIDYLHSEGVLHRDIKPENILILKGHAKVADFGLARHGGLMEATATFAGTLPYMAPEIYRGKVSARSDLYSLAITYAELRMGRRPFPSGNVYEAIMDGTERVPDVATLPAAEQQVLIRALAKDSGKRYETCEDFVGALYHSLVESELIREGSSTGIPRPPAPPPQRLTFKKILAVGLAMVLLLALGAWAAFSLIPRVTESTRPREAPVLLLLDELKGVTLRAGEAKTITIRVHRRDYQGPVQLAFTGLPDSVKISSVVIKEGESAVPVQVLVLPDPEAVPDSIQVTVQSEAGEFQEETRIELFRGKPRYHLPAGWKPAKGAQVKVEETEGRVYYDRIDLVQGELEIPFLLIPAGLHAEKALTQIPTFYMMQDKVSVALFSQLSASATKAETPFKSGVWKQLPRQFPLNWAPDHPVMGVTAPDADQAARMLGGRLPSLLQWDKAAGRYGKQWGSGSILSGYELARLCDQAGGIAASTFSPMPALPSLLYRGTLQNGRRPHDLSPFGIRDMAGNGLEWTSKAERIRVGAGAPKGPDDDFSTLGKDDVVYVRGWRFLEQTLPTYEELVADRPIFALFSESEREPQIGFRVVIEPKE